MFKSDGAKLADVTLEAAATPPPAAADATSLSISQKKREAWPAKEARLQSSSPLAGSVPGWQLTSFIVKSNDDLRQEVHHPHGLAPLPAHSGRPLHVPVHPTLLTVRCISLARSPRVLPARAAAANRSSSCR